MLNNLKCIDLHGTQIQTHICFGECIILWSSRINENVKHVIERRSSFQTDQAGKVIWLRKL